MSKSKHILNQAKITEFVGNKQKNMTIRDVMNHELDKRNSIPEAKKIFKKDSKEKRI